MNQIAELTLSGLYQLNTRRNEFYEEALIEACDECPPVFGTQSYGEGYRSVASNPTWLATSLVANSAQEAEGSIKLTKMAKSTKNVALASKILDHAADESRHARLYMRMLELVFPGAAEPKLVHHMRELSQIWKTPKVDTLCHEFAISATIDELIQMNIAEIRTRVHHLLQRPVLLNFCGKKEQSTILPILDSLMRDETIHVYYTADLINEYVTSAQRRQEVLRLFKERLSDFNEITTQSLKHDDFSSH